MTKELPAAVEVRGLTKYFGPNRVLDNIDLTFAPGSIHALLGANGSGKSTLIKILAGYHSPTAGSVWLHGEQISLPVDQVTLHERGVRFVHQDLGLIDTMSIADNLALTLGYDTRASAINWKEQRRSAYQDLATVGLEDLDPRMTVNRLGPVQQTFLAMARAIRGLEPGKGVLVLDEPTARLPNAQVDELLDRCRRLRDQGIALIYVSHRLDEVFAMADHVSVLRDGKLVFDDSIDATDDEQLTRVITGPTGVQAATSDGYERGVVDRSGSPTLTVSQLCGTRVRDASFTVHPGEILAVTGLVGSGRSELGRLIFGAQRISSGRVEFGGQVLRRFSPQQSMERGIGYVPQERRQATIAEFTVADNLSLASIDAHVSGGRLSAASQRDATVKAIEAMDVRPADPARRLGDLSGGNQQKVVLGKWLELDLRLLILDEPTYGVDVGARKTILRAVLDRVREQGLSVMLLDSDIDLVSRYADRVLIMRRGHITNELTGDEITTERIATASYAVGSAVGPANGTETTPA